MKTKTVINTPYDPRKILGHPQKLKSILDGQVPYPITLEVDLVDGGCNNRCAYCSFGSFKSKTPIFALPNSLLPALKTAYANGTKGVELVGGSEPTMHKDIARISESILDMGYDIGLITNGLLLPRIFPVAKHFTYIRISLDAASREVYEKTHRVKSFDIVIKNIRDLVSKHITSNNVGLGYLVVPDNADLSEIRKFIELAIDIGVGNIAFRPAYANNELNWDPAYLKDIYHHLEILREEYSDKITIYLSTKNRWDRALLQTRTYSGPCLTNLLTGVIKADGSIPFCTIRRNESPAILGNINDTPLENIWGSTLHRKLLKSMDVHKCPSPCKADDYREILLREQSAITEDGLNVSVTKEAHPNFV